MSDYDVDITGNIKIIEMLKVKLLTCISELYESMNQTTPDTEYRSQILANICIINYILASRIGVNYKNLDSKIISRLKVGILEENNNLYEDIKLLLNHMNKKES